MIYKEALIKRLTAFADDELLLAQRNAEWVGHAPLLEEDIALANITQDELGHATLFYKLRSLLDGSDPDDLVYKRSADDFRSAQLLELPRGDWAFTMLRQFFFDAYEQFLYEGLAKSSYQPLAEAAEKMRREDKFHLQHSALWIERLGLGSDEANERTQHALKTLYPYALQLFVLSADDELLVGEGVVPALNQVQEKWQALVLPHLKRSGLKAPADVSATEVDRSIHSKYLEPLLHELQSVARAVPAEVW